MRRENRQRVKDKLINSSLNENELGNGTMKLSLLEFNKQINHFQSNKLKRQKPKEFFSPSLNVSNYSLNRSKVIAANLSKDLGLELGNYVNRQIEQKLSK